MRSFTPYKTSKKFSSHLNSIKSVTPSSISKLSGVLTAPAKDLNSFYQCSSGKTGEIVSFKFDGEDIVRRSKLRRRAKVRVRSEKKLELKGNSPDVNRCLRYIEFKNYHETRFRRKKAFNDKNSPRLISSFKGKGPAAEENKGDLGRKEDSFATCTVYSRPALTYLEKLFRLNQVSIFN